MFIVFQGEMTLNRLAMASRQWHVVDTDGVTNSPFRKNCDRLTCPGSKDPTDPVIVPHANAGDVRERFLTFDPAIAAQDDPCVLVNDVIFFAEFDRCRLGFDQGSSGIAI